MRTKPLPARTDGPLTQINSPNEAFHRQERARERRSQSDCSQEAALCWILFSSLFTPSHLLSCALISLSGRWQLLPGAYLPLCQLARILPTNIRDYLSHQLRQANRTPARLLGIYWQLGGWMHLSNSRMCYCLMVAPPGPPPLTALLNHSAKTWWQNAGDWLQCCGPFPSLPRTAR